MGRFLHCGIKRMIEKDWTPRKGSTRNINQDAAAVFVKGTTGIFVLSDGMGGHSRGELVSAAIINCFQSFWEGLEQGGFLPDFQTLASQVQSVILCANREIYEKYNRGRICGATVAALVVSDGCYASFSVGDSRIYAYVNRDLKRLTVDDVWDNLPSVGASYMQMEIAGNKNRGKLTQAVGVKTQICIHVETDRIRRNQRFLICSDGLYRFCNEKQIGRIMRSISSEKALDRAADQMMQEVFDNGAGDNVSFILAGVTRRAG